MKWTLTSANLYSKDYNWSLSYNLGTYKGSQVFLFNWCTNESFTSFYETVILVDLANVVSSPNHYWVGPNWIISNNLGTQQGSEVFLINWYPNDSYCYGRMDFGILVEVTNVINKVYSSGLYCKRFTIINLQS